MLNQSLNSCTDAFNTVFRLSGLTIDTIHLLRQSFRSLITTLTRGIKHRLSTKDSGPDTKTSLLVRAGDSTMSDRTVIPHSYTTLHPLPADLVICGTVDVILQELQKVI